MMWYNLSGQVRIYNMVQTVATGSSLVNVYGGVPLPVFYGETENQSLQKQQNKAAKLVEEFGSMWFEREAKDLLPEGFTHPSSPNGTFTKKWTSWTYGSDSGSLTRWCISAQN